MRFGIFGRETGSLVMVLVNGGLVIRILKRTANLSDQVVNDLLSDPREPLRETKIPIPIPKKTKLYLEIVENERKESKGICSFK